MGFDWLVTRWLVLLGCTSNAGSMRLWPASGRATSHRPDAKSVRLLCLPAAPTSALRFPLPGLQIHVYTSYSNPDIDYKNVQTIIESTEELDVWRCQQRGEPWHWGWGHTGRASKPS